MIQEALLYARLGWRVLPVGPAKTPMTAHGVYDATLDPEVITRWWTQWPNANIGVAMGAETGLVALDVDAGKRGFESLENLTAAHGALPATCTSITGGGGRHYFFKHPGGRVLNSVSTLGPGLDVRGDGGYVVVAPSKHASGNHYVWETPPTVTPPAELPAWLREAITTNRSAHTPTLSVGNPLASAEPISEGGRNDALFRMAGILRAQGMDEPDIASTLQAVNLTRCVPPLPDSEINTIARSVCRYEAGPVLIKDWDGSGDLTSTSGGQPFQPRGAQLPDETDLGNARRFAEQHGADARFVKSWGRWLLWTGTHWRTSDTSEAERLAHATAEAIADEVRSMRAEFATLSAELSTATQTQLTSLNSGTGIDPYALDKLRRRAADLEQNIKALGKHSRESKSERALRAMLRLAGQLTNIDTPVSDLDRNPFLFSCANGTLDLQTGALRDHSRNDLLTTCSPVAYEPAAACPRWESFLLEIMNGDADLVAYLQRAVGYSLTGSVSAQVLFFLYGGGRNGKSTFVNILRQLLGNYSAVGVPALLEEGDRHPTELADLCGKRVVIISETEDSRPLPQAQIKRLTSEEPIRARRMREDSWEFLPSHKLWISGNHRPTVRNADLGIWRRLQMIPFSYTVAADRVDMELPAALSAELPGILAWALRGLISFRTDGLNPPEAVLAAIEDYRQTEDIVGQFLGECCARGPNFSVGSNELFQHYVVWAESCNYKPLDIKKFRQRMLAAGFEPHRFSRGVVFQGVKKQTTDLKEVR